MGRQFDEVMLGTIELFCLCAEAGSFTAAAARAGLSPPAVSRTIGRLERRLGVALFVRTTRRMRLTEAGERYFHQCREALARLGEAERELTGRQIVPAGTVRISVPTPLGHLRVLPALPEFRARYPQVQVEVHLGNRNVDLIAEGFDLAIRGRTPPESGLVARPLLDAELVVVAAPAYLDRAGIPVTLADLEQHDCIQFALPRSGQTVPWLFRDDDRDLELPTRGGLCISEDLLGCVTLARSGGGLLQTYRFIVEEALRGGTLVEVLAPFGGRSRPFSLLYPRYAHTPHRVRVLIEFLVERLGSR